MTWLQLGGVCVVTGVIGWTCETIRWKRERAERLKRWAEEDRFREEQFRLWLERLGRP